jgi:hypothetical protein
MSQHLVNVLVAVGVVWIVIPLAIIAGVAWVSRREGRR